MRKAKKKVGRDSLSRNKTTGTLFAQTSRGGPVWKTRKGRLLWSRGDKERWGVGGQKNRGTFNHRSPKDGQVGGGKRMITGRLWAQEKSKKG